MEFPLACKIIILAGNFSHKSCIMKSSKKNNSAEETRFLKINSKESITCDELLKAMKLVKTRTIKSVF